MKNNFPKISFFLSLALFIFFCLVFVFMYREIKNNDQESRLKEFKWQNETQRRSEIKALDLSVRTIATERKEIETHFAQSSNIVPFLNTIEELALKVDAKAEVTSVEILPDNSGLMVGMKALGTFNGLYKFITLLENSPYELEFIGIDMHQELAEGAKGKNTAIHKWNVIFKIKLITFTK